MNYAVIQTIFSDLRVGKTNLGPGIGIFATWDEAQDMALDLETSVYNRLELEEAQEEDAEMIHTDMEKWIVTC